MVSHCRVAVIGAGAAGLVAARELRKEGHEVVVYEKNDQVGGTWVYNPNVEYDLLGLDPNRSIIHSSLYESLRINFPREAMGYLDFPFVIRQGHGRDPRRYPGRTEVLMYLQEFANRFRIEEMARFNCEVISVEMVDNNYKKWKVKSKKRFENESHEIFDAVVVCNGHNSQPRLADIPGINLWPGKQIHSHNYRIPMPFKDKVVVIIGNAQSAADISAEIAQVAKEVYIAVRSVPDDTCKRQPGFENIWRHSMIERCCEDGTVVFRDGSIILADVIMHCTGYKYHFPFLKINDVVTVNDNRVEPLYKHVFPPALAPRLSFVGVPWKVLPFACYELQSKWLAGVLSGRILLPSEEKMMEDINTFYSKLEASNMPKRYTHNMLLCQPDYLDWLAEVCQCPSYEKWRVEMYYSTVKNAIKWPKTYRDKWEDHDLVLQAHNDFKKYIRLNSNL